MKVPLSWLKDFVPIVVPVEQLGQLLTSAGLEVESVTTIGEAWEGLVVGKILTLARHPRADRLQIAEVDVGDGSPRTIVCGAHNIAPGHTVPVVLPGYAVAGMQIERRVVRGIESQGMLCSPKELGISDDHSGIYLLEEGPLPGTPLKDAVGDDVLDLYISPNRPDCLAVRGLAVEVAALTAQPAHLPRSAPQERGEPASMGVRVTIVDPRLCRRYATRIVRGVKVGASPQWLRQRLERAGIRSINNVVDISNYVMLEFGQPLHFFDYREIRGSEIIVRPARDGERFQTLDGTEHRLPAGALLICDAERPIALAGVMGGLNSEVSERTVDVLIESASFDPVSIRTTSRSLRLRSEASLRFERGIDPNYVRPAIDRAAELLTLLTEGEVAPGVVDVYPFPETARVIALSRATVNELLGSSYSVEHIERVLTSLGYTLANVGSGAWNVTVPTARRDVHLDVDLIEDVARISGYDTIPTKLPSTEQPPTSSDAWSAFEERLRHVLLGLGLTEVVSYALTSRESMKRLLAAAIPDHSAYGDTDGALPILRPAALERLIEEAVTVTNPLSADWSALRVTLLDSALHTIVANAHSSESIRTFELGRVYEWAGVDRLPVERSSLVIAVAGQQADTSWVEHPQPVDFWSLKGIVEGVFSRLAVAPVDWKPVEHPAFHPGRTALLTMGGQPFGIVGEVHPVVRERCDIDSRAYLAELDIERLETVAQWSKPEPSSRFPSLPLDLAFVVAEDTPAGTVLSAVREAAGPLCQRVRLFDVYRGKPIAEGRKSLAFSLVFQSLDRTLRLSEIEAIRDGIRDVLAEQFGAMLRDS
ncbi:MAG: phenylalanine--tRNA ligase subunit beta [Chloroflexi bacterium]|nr:phenylalanine--tRNA ligase subunit beta [Chloroflexota bacterium]